MHDDAYLGRVFFVLGSGDLISSTQCNFYVRLHRFKVLARSLVCIFGCICECVYLWVCVLVLSRCSLSRGFMCSLWSACVSALCVRFGAEQVKWNYRGGHNGLTRANRSPPRLMRLLSVCVHAARILCRRCIRTNIVMGMLVCVCIKSGNCDCERCVRLHCISDI